MSLLLSIAAAVKQADALLTNCSNSLADILQRDYVGNLTTDVVELGKILEHSPNNDASDSMSPLTDEKMKEM